MKTLLDNNVFGQIEGIFGRTYVWQQDNAPSHKSKYTLGFLSKIIPEYLPWPPRSPDLSPIEQVWAYIKKKLAGRHFVQLHTNGTIYQMKNFIIIIVHFGLVVSFVNKIMGNV